MSSTTGDVILKALPGFAVGSGFLTLSAVGLNMYDRCPAFGANTNTAKQLRVIFILGLLAGLGLILFNGGRVALKVMSTPSK